MTTSTKHRILLILIASVWLINGLLCKVLGLVSRHELIVSRILGDECSRFLTIFIGVAEIFMAIWILSGYRSKENTIVQIVIVAIMNLLEFVLVPDLLLWGRFNALVALIFISFVYYNEFILRKKLMSQSQK